MFRVVSKESYEHLAPPEPRQSLQCWGAINILYLWDFI